MSYKFKFLSGVDTHLLYETFLSAFSDYVQDVSHVTETNFVNRFTRGGVDYDTSVGVYYEGKLVGFTMIALDNFKGSYAAFDAMTGLVKEHRGKGLAKEIFEHALPRLREKGVKDFYLEVIQKNKPAVRAYEKTGFAIEREMDAFGLPADAAPLEIPAGVEVEIRSIEREDLHRAAGFFDWQPSWENSLASIQRVPDEVICLGAFQGAKLIGALAHHPASTWLLSLAVDPAARRQGVGTALLAALQARLGEKRNTIKVINVDHADEGMLRFLERTGFEFLINQFEMKLAIEA